MDRSKSQEQRKACQRETCAGMSTGRRGIGKRAETTGEPGQDLGDGNGEILAIARRADPVHPREIPHRRKRRRKKKRNTRKRKRIPLRRKSGTLQIPRVRRKG